MVGLDESDTRVEGVDYSTDSLKFVFGDKVFFIDDKSGTELYLLHEEAFDVFFVALAQEGFTACKFIDKTLGIDNTYDVVKNAVAYCQDFLCNWHGFAYATGFDEDIVVATCSNKVLNVLRHLTFERTADATIGEGDNALRVGDVGTIGNEASVDIYFTDVVNDDGNAIALLVVQDAVEERCLASTEVSAEECYGCFVHNYLFFQ